MTNTLYIDENYSTTRLLTKEKSTIENRAEDKFETVLFLPEGENRKGEGGLRSKGYFKKSYENKPLISIITVVFNGEKYLEETLKSVIDQSYDNVEYIIIDGGSIDGTVDIIRKYEDQIDYWVSEKDKGIYDAMNKGLFLATGDWVAFMNGGDSYYGVNALNNLIENSKFAKVVYGHRNCVYDDHSYVSYASLFKRGGISLPFCHQSCIIETNLHKIYPYDIAFKIHADSDFFYKLYSKGAKFIKIDKVISNYAMDGISIHITPDVREERRMIVFKYNKNLLYKIKYFFWEFRRVFSYNIKQLPFSAHLLKLKHFVQSKIRNEEEH